MFKQLKRRMLLLNLFILTVLLITVFASLYISTYRNIQTTIDRELTKVVERATDYIPGTTPPEPGDLLPDRQIAFVIITDLQGEILSTDAKFESTDEFFTTALTLIDDVEGTIALDDNYWAYRVVDLETEIVYAFSESTSAHNLLVDMIQTFLLIFVISFLFLYVISSYMTNKSVVKIKEAFIKQKQFVSNASHELKTPLAIINTNLDILMAKPEEPNRSKWLGYIKFVTERMNKLTRDLLYLTRVSDQNSNTVIKERFNLSEVTESIVLSFEALAYEKNIRINYVLGEDIFTEFSRDQYNQVVHILLDNAIKYSPEGKDIDVNLNATHNFINFSVKNAGEGITKEDLPYIFDRFYMGDKARSTHPNSYGLGLSIAKSIVENHGGKIICESVPNEHTEFVIKLRIKPL